MLNIWYVPSLIPRPYIGEKAWQLPQVQTVYGCDVMAIVMSHSNSLEHVILKIFLAVRMGLSC